MALLPMLLLSLLLLLKFFMADTVYFTPAHPPCESSHKSSKSTFAILVETGKPHLGA